MVADGERQRGGTIVVAGSLSFLILSLANRRDRPVVKLVVAIYQYCTVLLLYVAQHGDVLSESLSAMLHIQYIR